MTITRPKARYLIAPIVILFTMVSISAHDLTIHEQIALGLAGPEALRELYYPFDNFDDTFNFARALAFLTFGLIGLAIFIAVWRSRRK